MYQRKAILEQLHEPQIGFLPIMIWKRRISTTAISLAMNSALFRSAVRAQDTTTSNVVQVAGILDTVNLGWAEDVWNVTTQLLKEGDWLKTVIPEFGGSNIDDTEFAFTLRNAACDATTAVREYWAEREDGTPPNAIVGAYCSGASISLARVAGLEQVPMLSPFSASSQLSETAEFPYFSRIVAPDDSRGGVGAMVATLSELGWKRVSLLATDLQYAQGKP